MTDFLGVDRLPLSEKDLAARLPAAKARSVLVAATARKSADWIREHDGARIVGRVKRSRLVQHALYRPIDRAAVRPARPTWPPSGVRWPPRSRRWSTRSGCRCGKPGAGSGEAALLHSIGAGSTEVCGRWVEGARD